MSFGTVELKFTLVISLELKDKKDLMLKIPLFKRTQLLVSSTCEKPLTVQRK